MPLIPSHPPEDHRMLCEGCGYILEGLPTGLADDTRARCPECGKPIAESTSPFARRPSAWDNHPDPLTFLQTSWQALIAPSHFFRHLTARTDTRPSSWFATLWRGISSILLAIAMFHHLNWVERQRGIVVNVPQIIIVAYAILKIFSVVWIYLALWLVSSAASRLTAWEARYRSLRLPLATVRLGLHYHAVHLAPIALAAALIATFFPHQRFGDLAYMYTLCGLVILAAAYLLFTYWAAMRNMLYANR